MAKIGTAQIEIAPHISDEALDAIAQKVADAVERGVRRGMAAAFAPPVSPFPHIIPIISTTTGTVRMTNASE